MIEKELKGLDQKIYIETLANGLEVYLIPFEKRKNYYIDYIVNFGATINKFKDVESNKIVTVPYGVAHFLEHKMFEQENKEDPFKVFSRYGSDANAATGYKSTSYTVEGTTNIEESLDYLLTYVNNPYFTVENVEKEKNIIIEEINMYNDDPEGKLFKESSRGIFKVHPMRIDIGGTEKSIKSITKENLYSCYNTFYQPSNMKLFIGGNFDIDKIMNIIKSNEALSKRKSKEEIVVKKAKEQDRVNIKFKEIKIEGMVIPKMIFTIKIPLKKKTGIELFEYVLSTTLLYGIIYGNSSKFREEILNLGLISIFATSNVVIDDFLLVEFAAESKDPKTLSNMIIEEFKTCDITKEAVERHKKSYIASQVLNTDQVVSTVNMISDSIMNYSDILPNRIDIIRNINLEKILDVKQSIDIENSSVVVAYPKK